AEDGALEAEGVDGRLADARQHDPDVVLQDVPHVPLRVVAWRSTSPANFGDSARAKSALMAAEAGSSRFSLIFWTSPSVTPTSSARACQMGMPASAIWRMSWALTTPFDDIWPRARMIRPSTSPALPGEAAVRFISRVAIGMTCSALNPWTRS